MPDGICKAKSRQSSKRAGYYQQQSLRTARNKTNRHAKRIRLLKVRPKQPTVEEFTVFGGSEGPGMVKVSAILKAKQTRRKARNNQRRTRLLHTKAAAEIVQPVVESTAE